MTRSEAAPALTLIIAWSIAWARCAPIGHWTKCARLFALPFSDLIYHAQRVHRLYFDPNQVQISTLLSIKTGACPGGLLLLLAEHPLRDRAEVRAADGS